MTALAAGAPALRDGLSALRALSAHDGRRERGIRPRGAGARAGRVRRARRGDPRRRGSRRLRRAARHRFREASSSAWRSPARWRPSRACCCWTSRSRTSIPTLRERTRRELKRIITRIGITTLFVTHEQEEAFELGDRVAVLNDGRLEQVGTPEELYEKPATRFVATFVGRSSVDARRLGGRRPRRGFRRARWAAVAADAPPPRARRSTSSCGRRRLAFSVRKLRGAIRGEVLERRYAGRTAFYLVRLSEAGEVEVLAASRAARVGQKVGVRSPLPAALPRAFTPGRRAEAAGALGRRAHPSARLARRLSAPVDSRRSARPARLDAGELLAVPSAGRRVARALGSIWISIATVILSAAVGIPLAFLFERTEFPGRRTIGALIALPVVLPPLVGVVAFLFL